MMKLVCHRCERVLEYVGERPSFCAYCGSSLPQSGEDAQALTEEYQEKPSDTPSNPSTFSALPIPSTPSAPVLGVGNYRIIRRLGSGGMGTVYEAEDHDTGQRVALKVLKPQAASNPGAIERFRQEGKVASMIAHPRCVFVLKTDEEAGQPYIVMELMPGATLKELVEQQGRLPPTAAVAKILDVIEGLLVAHELGVIHRDVKPSNCFLMPDGRVKIGDFGLAKALQGAAHITRTGAFLGTPLFASTEQIKGEPIDFRTDVYSVAATLYYLLVGRAPFEGGDPTATVARIVSEPAPDLGKVRPDLPSALVAAVMKGLERKKENRWRDLEEFRQELLPFMPGSEKPASRTARLRAILMDAVLLLPIMLLLGHLLGQLMAQVSPMSAKELGVLPDLLLDLLYGFIVFLYFALVEGLSGASVGKRIMRLRVRSLLTGVRPPFSTVLIRTACFCALVGAPGKAAFYLTGSHWAEWGLHIAGVLLLIDTMRRGSGYRGLHELVSGTRVMQLPWPKQPLRLQIDWPGQCGEVPELLQQIGPYAVHGVLEAAPDSFLLLGEERVLGRQILLHVRPALLDPLPAPRRDVTRSSRLRWISGGQLSVSGNPFRVTETVQTDKQMMLEWDAYLGVPCSPLPRVVATQGRLTWSDTRVILEQLTEELLAGAADGTIPPILHVDQVHVQPTGHLLLIGSAALPPNTTAGDAKTDDERGLQLLREVTILMLEGKLRSTRPPHSARAPMPYYARELTDRLLGVRQPYTTLAEVQADLKATRDQPNEVNRALRLGPLGVLGTCLAPILLGMFIIGRFYNEIGPNIRRALDIERADRVLTWLDQPRREDGLGEFLHAHLQLTGPGRRGGNDPLVVPFALPPDAPLLRQASDQVAYRLIKEHLRHKRAEDVRRFQQEKNPAVVLTTRFAVTLVQGPLSNRKRQERDSAFQADQEWRDLKLALDHAWPPPGPRRHPPPESEEVEINPLFLAWFAITLWPALWVVWAFVARGGLSLHLLGLDIVRHDGRPAARWQCALRAFLVWSPLVLLLCFSIWVQEAYPGYGWLSWSVWWVAVLLLAGYVVVALEYPQRAIHDRLARVYIVPR
jgi:hypothetical protein